mmetsp:Transcript_22885/g.60457  ORF Transcript_22885/g.60457 Transcript_22885/m.60457 type:complete len:230 (+) Transcript_22885:51-740(+)
MLRWCIFSVTFLALQPACLALVLGQIHGTDGDIVGLQPLPALSDTSAGHVADVSVPLRSEKKTEEYWLTSLSAAPMNAVTALRAKLPEANFESAFQDLGDTMGLQPLPASFDSSTGQVVDVPAPLRPEKRSEQQWLTSPSAGPLNVLDHALKVPSSSAKLDGLPSEAVFGSVFPWWAQLLLAQACVIIAALLTYFWPSSHPHAAHALTQFEKISFEPAGNEWVRHDFVQ